MKLVIDGKLKPAILTIRDGRPYYDGSLDLSGTQITVLPDNLTVGGYLDLEGTGIINYPIVYNCGNEDRAIYLDLEDKSLIRIGCFIGDEPEAVKAIKQKYIGEKADAYISKVRECFEIWEKMQEVSAGQA